MSTETSTASKVVGTLIANGVQLGLMTWAGVETGGVLRWALFAWVAFTVGAFIAFSAVRNAQ